LAAKKRQPEIAAAAASRANSRGGFAYVRGTKKSADTGLAAALSEIGTCEKELPRLEAGAGRPLSKRIAAATCKIDGTRTIQGWFAPNSAIEWRWPGAAG